MKFFFIIFSILIIANTSQASDNHSSDNRKFYENRVKFIKEYIKDLKEKRKNNKYLNGSVVETISGNFYTRLGTDTQKKIDQEAINDCIKDGGIECLVRFRSLKKNPEYNRFAKLNKLKKTLKVLDEYISVKKVYSVKGIDILIATKDFKNKKDFSCTKIKSSFRSILSVLKNEIELYPTSFLKKSGLKYIMICEKIIDKGISPVGMAPGHFDQSPGVFYINVDEINSQQEKDKDGIIKHVFHHEFYHIIDASLTKVYLDDKWNNLNLQKYSDVLLVDRNRIDNSVKGYISKYARNSAAEDKAELFAFMISQHKDFKKTLANDEILRKKSKLMISRLKSISKDINKNFWKRLN